MKFWYCQYFFNGLSLRKIVFGEKTVVLASQKFVSVMRVKVRCCDATEGALGVPRDPMGGTQGSHGGVPRDPMGGPLDPWALGDHGPVGTLGPWGPWAHGTHGPLGPVQGCISPDVSPPVKVIFVLE